MEPIGLELRHHALVVATAEEGTLTAAGRRLHLTPSALSHQLRDAEDRLGTRLFQRRHRRLLLTAAGERLLASSRRVLAEAAAAERGVRGSPGEDLLRISSGCYTAYGWLPAVLRRFRRMHPGVEVRIVLESTRRPVEGLLRGELDLALTSDEVAHPRLHATPLFDDELVLLVGSTHRLAGRPFAVAGDLAAETLLTYDAPREELDVFRRVLWPAGVEPARVSRVPLTEAIVELVRGGEGAGILARWALPRDRRGLATLGLTRTGLRRTWSAVRLRTRSVSGALEDFVALLRQQLAGGRAGQAA